MRTREIHVLAETWRFYCLDCLTPYQAMYEAWHADDGHGGDSVAWRRDGMASQPPWTEPSCPDCLGLHVKVLPAGSFVPQQR